MIKIFLLSNNVESAKEEKRGEERKKKQPWKPLNLQWNENYSENELPQMTDIHAIIMPKK